MLFGLDSLSIGTLAGIFSGAALVIAGAAVRTFNNRRSNRLVKSTDVVRRLDVLETRFDTLNAGLFGEDTDFGHKIGFVDEVRKSLGLISTIHAEVTPNGGASMKDVSNETHRRQEGESK